MRETDQEIVEWFIKRFGEASHEPKEYTYPRHLTIGGIDTIIVDPHNEAFPFWYLKNKPSATLIHIDKHSDTLDGSRSLEYLEKQKETFGKVCPVAYSKYYNTHGSFISTAIFYELISDVFWICPQKNKILRLGDPGDSTLKKWVTESDGRIIWNVDYKPRQPPGYTVSENQMILEMDPTLPLILDIDLDAFESRGDTNHLLKTVFSFGTYSLLSKPLGVSKRFKVFDTLTKMPRPQRITIARSQTPICYAPRSKVDYLESRVLEELEKLYNN